MCLCNFISVLGLLCGEILYAVQKLVQFAVIASVFASLVFMFTIILMLGVGLGYNHCYVEINKKGTLRDGEDTGLDSYDLFSDTEKRLKRRENTNRSDDIGNVTMDDNYTLSSTMIIPLRSMINISQLLSKIIRQEKNVTVQFVVSDWKKWS